MEDFVGAKFYCPHALADGKQHVWIMQKTLEFSSTVLSTLSPYLRSLKTLNTINVWNKSITIC